MKTHNQALTNYSINTSALSYIEENLRPFQKKLGINLMELDNGCKILDMGVNAQSGWRAGIAMAEICMGCLGTASLHVEQLDGESIPYVHVQIDYPATIELCSHICIGAVGSLGILYCRRLYSR